MKISGHRGYVLVEQEKPLYIAVEHDQWGLHIGLRGGLDADEIDEFLAAIKRCLRVAASISPEALKEVPPGIPLTPRSLSAALEEIRPELERQCNESLGPP